MNKMRETAMWRDNNLGKPDLTKSDLTRPAPHHTARDRSEPRGNRPRITAGQRLAQALFDRAGPLARLVRHGETQWSSATFSGSRHTFVLRFQGIEALSAAELLVIAIGDDAITVPRALIAEMTVTRFTQTLLPHPEAEMEISALLLDQ
ncbi:hypothetical protein [Novosphingobium sp.]|uniref:hypothetical protein n=1 Tax=Novosphingobium sp. TaxID=1874826 RepID=UPI00333FB797